MGNFNSPEMKLSLSSYNMNNTLNYETPPGQRPTLNSYLLWAARRKNIPAATLWVPVPFYIATSGDPRAELRVLEFFNRKFNLHLAMDDLDEEVRQQNRTISRIRDESADIDNTIRKIETGDTLSAEESQHLASHIEQSLSRKQV
jgi:proteasome assembly chaperone (PAC2) family protein